MPLTLSIRQPIPLSLEVDSVRLENVREQSAAEVLATPVQYGNETPPLGEFCDAAGSAAEDQQIIWQGDCSRVKYIGAQLTGGTVRVEGDAGMHLGAEMTGGEIIVDGNVDDWAGAEMKGGRIRIHGNAGHCLGAVYRGGTRGMAGGEILVDGNAGDEIGHTMRRGLIAVAGKAGDAVGYRMIAGSIFLFGETGIRIGAAMKRGTIGLFGSASAPPMLPSFRYACQYRPVFLQLYFAHLRSLGFLVPEECLAADYRRYSGDFLELGKGEILVRE